MTREQFAIHLEDAAERALRFTRTLVSNALPDDCLFLLRPNSSYDGNALRPDEKIFPEDALPQGRYLGPVEAERVVEYLWRDGRIPEWIKMTVLRADEHHTFLLLKCYGRFTADDTLLYHQAEGKPPFHVLGPPIPQGWLVGENGKRDWQMSWKKMLELHGKYPLPLPEQDEP